MNTNSTQTKRTGVGVYELPDGSQVRWAYVNRKGVPVRRGWHLIDAHGDWATTVWTKAEAIEAWEATQR
jgi:hypothetical protein